MRCRQHRLPLISRRMWLISGIANHWSIASACLFGIANHWSDGFRRFFLHVFRQSCYQSGARVFVVPLSTFFAIGAPDSTRVIRCGLMQL